MVFQKTVKHLKVRTLSPINTEEFEQSYHWHTRAAKAERPHIPAKSLLSSSQCNQIVEAISGHFMLKKNFSGFVRAPEWAARHWARIYGEIGCFKYEVTGLL